MEWTSQKVDESKYWVGGSANDANFREKGNTDLLGFRRISTDSLFVAGFLGSGLGRSGLKS